MTAPVALLLFAAAASVYGTHVLARASWPRTAPALGIAVWQALTAAIALAVLLAGLALAMPELHLSSDLAGILRACVEEVRHQYATPGGALLSLAGGVFTLALLARLGAQTAVSMTRSRLDRRRHLAALALISDYSWATGITVVDHDVPLAYCLPGRKQRIVVTRGATEVLSEQQLDGVLTHELAHLRARHHLVVAAATVLARTFTGMRVFGVAREHIAELAEMHADDAVDVDRRPDLASALLRLAGAVTPAGALGAGGQTALVRVVRLAKPEGQMSPRIRASIMAGVVGLVLAPLALSMLPAGAALVIDCCAAVLRAS